MKKSVRRAQRGFTLIELMMVVGITGVLASLAGPAVFNVLRKSKRTEISGQVAKMLQASKDFISTHEHFPTVSGADSTLFADFNPPLPLSGARKPFNNSVTGWSDLQYSADGWLYGHYQVLGEARAGQVATLSVTVWTDLDGDGKEAVYIVQQEFRGGTWVSMKDEWDLTKDDW